VQQNGRIRVVQLGAVLATDFLDVSGSIVAGGEQGLLGFAFPPDTATSGRFFVNFTNRSGDTVVARFRRSSPVVADIGSRFDLRWGGANGPASIAQPFANHNGGHLAFGPDGSSTSARRRRSGDDPSHRAQWQWRNFSVMLRIDNAGRQRVRALVPADNHFPQRTAVDAA
jgi:hypothetical protein